VIWSRWPNSAALFLFTTALTTSLNSFAQEYALTGDRKVVTKIAPRYTALARNMHLGGVVKVEAVVFSNGLVKNLCVMGGHPLLVQSATDAVRRWKWETASHESTESIEDKIQSGINCGAVLRLQSKSAGVIQIPVIFLLAEMTC
jgi:outer membrane biosynthesis protein TonB